MTVAVPKRSTRLPVSPVTHTGAGTRTLCIDIGGTGIKALVLDLKGAPLTERSRQPTPKPAKPEAVLETLWTVIDPLGDFDRVSVGFPGVVVEGVTWSAPNLHPDWKNFPLAQHIAERTRRPVRVLNDAGVQGFGIIEGHGLEMVLTLGTGMGCALYIDGKYVPNVELAHHPLTSKTMTYEDYVGAAALEKAGKKKWNKHVRKVLATVQPIFNPRVIYLGGGNAKFLKGELPTNVKVTSNIAGLLGGIALWNEPGIQLDTPEPKPKTKR
jgi:polyphosphate glucokinase